GLLQYAQDFRMCFSALCLTPFLPVIPVGAYNLAFELPGFRRTEVQGFTLQVDQRARIDTVLQPGEVKETITVVGEGLAQLETDSSSTGMVVNPSDLRD